MWWAPGGSRATPATPAARLEKAKATAALRKGTMVPVPMPSHVASTGSGPGGGQRSLQQGNVIREVIVTAAEAAQAAPLRDHQAERKHEERTNGCHDVCDGHQRRLVRLGDVVATVLHVGVQERPVH